MIDFDASLYPQPLPHESIREIGSDLYYAPGHFDLAPMMRVSRNMVIVRNGGELTLVNPIRLSPEGEGELESLGHVRHAIRLGFFHGVDDAYIVARFGAEFWCQAQSTHHKQPKPNHILTEGGPLPLPGATLLEFRETRRPECVLRIPHGGGTLLTCDALQHYGSFERHSLVAKMAMPLMGFRRTLLIGPLWLKYMTKEGGSLRSDFERIAGLQFDALVAAHGTPLTSGAHEALRAAIDFAYR